MARHGKRLWDVKRMGSCFSRLFPLLGSCFRGLLKGLGTPGCRSATGQVLLMSEGSHCLGNVKTPLCRQTNL